VTFGETDRGRLRPELDRIAVCIGRKLAVRIRRMVREFLHLTERNKTNVVRAV
jgi:hypothetical protein